MWLLLESGSLDSAVQEFFIGIYKYGKCTRQLKIKTEVNDLHKI